MDEKNSLGSFNNYYQSNKLKLTKKSKFNLALKTLIITLFFVFFSMSTVLYSKMESIELKLYKRKKYYLFSIIFPDNLMLSSTFKTFVDEILIIISGLNSLTVYISIIYLTFHPFIGLKLVFVVNISHYCLLIIKIIFQAHRPFWDLTDEKLINEALCKNDYASPSVNLFFCSFFSLYSIISIKLLTKKKFDNFHKALIFWFHFMFIGILIIILGVALEEYFHQLIFTIIISFVLICFLLEKDKHIHNNIFKTLKNVYNTRIYKMKIFFYILGLIVITIISLYFIDEKESNTIKQQLKNISNCKDEDFEMFGIKQSFNDLSYIFGVVGAFWGASFTVEKNIGKWWGKSSKRIVIIKIISIIIVNLVFIFAKYFLPYLFNNYEFNFILGSALNFLQYFCLFGVIPLFLDEMELIERKKLKNNNEEDINYKNRIKENDDDEVILFRTSIFKDEKKIGDDEGFVILDKEVKKREDFSKNKNDDETRNNISTEIQNSDIYNDRLEKSDDENEVNEILYDKKKEDEKGQIYGPSPLVENVQRLEDEEEYNLVFEGMDDLEVDKNKQDD